jgi:hypothetical protein
MAIIRLIGIAVMAPGTVVFLSASLRYVRAGLRSRAATFAVLGAGALAWTVADAAILMGARGLATVAQLVAAFLFACGGMRVLVEVAPHRTDRVQ